MALHLHYYLIYMFLQHFGDGANMTVIMTFNLFASMIKSVLLTFFTLAEENFDTWRDKRGTATVASKGRMGSNKSSIGMENSVPFLPEIFYYYEHVWFSVVNVRLDLKVHLSKRNSIVNWVQPYFCNLPIENQTCTCLIS